MSASWRRPRFADAAGSASTSISTILAPLIGWGLYSESLGREMGFYKDPYSRFGQLT